MKTAGYSHWRILVALLAVLLWPPHQATAASPADTLREFFRQAIAVVDDPRTETHPQEALRKIRQLADRIFDVREAAPAALGPHWNARSPAEREEFTRLLGQLLEQAYLAWIKSLIGGRRIDIGYEGETMHGTDAVVRTTVQGRDGRRVPFDYRMSMTRGQWKIRDVLVDRVSIMDNYRAQFRRVLATASYAALIATMRARTTEQTDAKPELTIDATSAASRDSRPQAP